MGKIAKGLGYFALGASAFTLALGAGVYKFLWSTPVKRAFTTVGTIGIIAATQCSDEITKGYNTLTGIPQLEDSLRTQKVVMIDQEQKNKEQQRELTEIKYLANKKVDSLNYKINNQDEKIVTQSTALDKLNLVNKTQKDMYNKDLETIMNQNKIQEGKIDSMYKKLDYLIEQKAPVSAQQEVYESIMKLK